jgi:hypothetical protein
MTSEEKRQQEREEKGRLVQAEQVNTRRQAEAEARPDTMHRAIRFLLHQATINNHDIKGEADHYLALLDAEYGADPTAADGPKKRVSKPKSTSRFGSRTSPQATPAE